ncbi:protein of unknown function [Ferrithrix thermotolerans DSM 19514]|uniref:Cytoskeleton protein RodZ-like C-terminal domain-containing protein n=1 Tax=Ferrithrix thermotolerans DSM 19514 TaxID=1121881 RepID=A0A1M4VU26_9ACTN|nr:DUF4115 domain-containing protein [Ferrithrix thermotolerans]SHE72469.1 protein of unknown function [Ferrithrix thermotolerans DSM 19514]
MTAILVVAIIVLLVGAVSGATMSALGKERKSIESHKKILSVMEDLASSNSILKESNEPEVSRRSDRTRSHVRAVRPVRDGKSPTVGSSVVSESLSGAGIRKGRGRLIGLHGDRFVVEEAEEDPKTLQIPIVDLERPRQAFVGAESPATDALQQKHDVNNGGGGPSPIVIDDERIPDLEEMRQGTVPQHASRSSQVRIGSVVVAVGLGVIGVSTVVFKVATEKHSTVSSATQTQNTTARSQVSSSSTKKKHRVKSTTTTTSPQISPVSSNSLGATYQVPSGTLTIQLTASAPCWVEQSNSPYGKLFFAQTLAAGQTQTLTSTAPIWIRTGNVKALSIKINNLPVVISAPPGTYNFTFNAG